LRIGLAGLGRMGVPMAERLLAAGHELVVWNRTRAKAEEFAAGAASGEGGGATSGEVGVADSLAELLADGGLCLTVLADDAALEEVAGEALSGARGSGARASGAGGSGAGEVGGGTLVDHSTVSVPASQRVAQAAERAGVAYLRAPVSGNPGVVRAGNLAIVVSGPRDVYEQTKPILEAIGPHLFHVGEAEEARIAKLALNLMVAGTAELMAEAIVLGEAHGLDPKDLLEVMGGSAVGSPFVKYKTEPLLNGDYSATFTTEMMRKDAALIRDAAGERGIDLPVGGLLETLLEQTIAAGHGDADFMALLLRLRGD
jgi:3-hydroxyisobutyrate dehydrogenase-like beta-hydroxyacid dehydrogenase